MTKTSCDQGGRHYRHPQACKFVNGGLTQDEWRRLLSRYALEYQPSC